MAGTRWHRAGTLDGWVVFNPDVMDTPDVVRGWAEAINRERPSILLHRVGDSMFVTSVPLEEWPGDWQPG